VQKALAPQMDSVSTALARYDNESNGSYLVRGMNVTCLASSDTEQVFTINDGKAHVNGYEIEQDWTTDQKPKVTNNAIRVVQMADIEAIKNMILDLYYLMSQERLKNDANASDSSTKKGIFVDPFFDDDMRDQGIEQTGAIVDQCLVLPIRAEVHDLAKEQKVYMLPYELEPIISQELQTGSMKVNPYMAFDPIPADVNVTLNIDHWTEVETQWLSAVTQYVSRGSSYSTNSLVSSASRNAEFMRQLTQKIRIEGLKPGEVISEIKFDGISIEIRGTGVTPDPIV
jgi:hypothetical protein